MNRSVNYHSNRTTTHTATSRIAAKTLVQAFPVAWTTVIQCSTSSLTTYLNEWLPVQNTITRNGRRTPTHLRCSAETTLAARSTPFAIQTGNTSLVFKTLSDWRRLRSSGRRTCVIPQSGPELVWVTQRSNAGPPLWTNLPASLRLTEIIVLYGPGDRCRHLFITLSRRKKRHQFSVYCCFYKC